MIYFKTFLVFACLCHFIKTLGQVFDKPQQDQLQILKVTQLFYMNVNTTVSLTYNTPKLRQPSALITYNKIQTDHFADATPEVISWFNIRSDNITLTSIGIYLEANNQMSFPGLEYLSFSVLISCIDTKYLQIINWEYTGPRLLANENFFNITISPLPDPFAHCFTDAAQTVRDKINYMLTFNGFVGCNWMYISRDTIIHTNRLTFHIYDSSLPVFTIAMYSDHRSWLDKYWFGFLFICPNSYLLKNKYFSEFKSINIGTQSGCQTFASQATKSVTLLNTYSYLQFIGTKFILPNTNRVAGWRYSFEFSLDPTQNPLKRYYQAWKLCGLVDYHALFIVQKFCSGNRTFIQSSGSCICNNSLNFYESGTTNCDFICPTPLIVLNFECKTCLQIFGIGCIGCDNVTCSLCDSNFVLENNSCNCVNDRAIFNSTQCQFCTTVYDPKCEQCNNVSCLKCMGNYFLNNNKCQCSQGRLFFMGNCLLCTDLYGQGCLNCNEFTCIECATNWKLQTNGSCLCQFPDYLKPGTTQCIKYSNNTNNNDTKIEQKDSLVLSSSHIQLGSSLFVFFKFNKPMSEITQMVPFQTNVAIKLGSHLIVSGLKWSSDGLSIEIDLNQLPIQMDGKSDFNIAVEIINPNYLLWKQKPVDNQIKPIVVEPFMPQQQIGASIIEFLANFVLWIYPFVIVASWGVFNNGFQLWFLLASYLYLKPQIYGRTETALVAMNQNNLLTFSSLNQLIPQLEVIHENIDFTQVAMEKNKSFTQLTIIIFAVYLCSIVLCLSFRYYIKLKPNHKVYVIYNNFLVYYKEYMYTNFLALYSFLALPLCIQFEALFKNYWDLSAQEQFINIMVCTVVVLLIIILPLMGLFIFPLNQLKNTQQQQHKPNQQPIVHQIAYNKIFPSGMTVVIENFVRIFRTLVFVVVIFFCREFDSFIGELILISYNVAYLFIVVFNYRLYMAKLYWATCMIKNFVFIGFQIGFLFIPSNYQPFSSYSQNTLFSNNSICLWLIIFLIVFQLFELLAKLIRMFLTNKFDWKQLEIRSNKVIPTQMEENLFETQNKTAKNLNQN